jgi:Ca-activated chloride channel family protein
MWGYLLPLVCLLGLFTFQLGHAGAIIIPGRVTKNGVEPSRAMTPGLSVRYAKVMATVSNGKCVATITETIGCGAQGVDAIAVIPLPKGTLATGHKAVVDGRELDVRYVDSKDVNSIYETIARYSGKSVVLSHADRPALLIGGLKLSKAVDLTLTIQLPVGINRAVTELTLPMPDPTFYDKPITGVSVQANLVTSEPVRGVFSPSHEVRIKRDTLRSVVVSGSYRNYVESGGLKLFFAQDADPLGMKLLTYHDDDEKDGYFMLFGNPTGSDREEKPTPKDVVFALDISGSMRGEKMEQARSAIAYCLKKLNTEDRFNVIAFGTEVTRFKSEPTMADDDRIEEALAFVDELISKGRTNIRGALEAALKGGHDKDRPSFVMFLTDGTPTVGERKPKKILEAVSELNVGKKKIFVIGVGHDVNAHLLDKLALEHDGASVYVAPEESIDEKVAILFERLKNPVLSDVKIDFGGLKVHGAFPRKVPTLFKGTDLILFGRYSGGGRTTVSVVGSVGSKEKRFEYPFEFPEKASSERDFVASLWATRKIGFLMQNLRLNGENSELIDEVVRLSRKYGIVTEYTSFVAMKNVSLEKAKELAMKKMRSASTVSSGKWAVQQAKNDQEMQQRMVANDSVNAYVDRNGRRKTAAIKRVAGRTFYQRDGVWEESEEKGDRQVRKVKKFSKEYFELVKTNKAFADAQRLNGKMSINIDAERVVVEE